MSEWQTFALEDIAEIFDGPHATPSKVTEGPIFLGISNLVDGRIDLTQVDRISEDDFARWTRRVTPSPGDVVFSYETKLGESAMIPNGLRCCLGRRMGLLRPKPGVVEPRFLGFAYRSPGFQETLRKRAIHGSTVDRIPLIEMPSFPISIPRRLETQRSIARILGALDDKIELNRRMNETLEAMARALFKSWFVDFDPTRAKAEGRRAFQDTEIGDVPSGWTVEPVYEIASYINGAAYAAFNPNDERRGLPIIKIAELKAGITAQTKFSDLAMPAKYRLELGDILFSWSGNPDTSIDTFVWSHGPAWLNQHIFRVVPRHSGERAFILSLLRYLKPVWAEIARNKQTTGLGHVTAADMKRLKVAVPTEETMQLWEKVAGPLHKRQLHIQIESQKLSQLRDALLPRLFSGELRVPDAERLVESVL